ncbi:MAG: DUF5916 domain-containing protein [Bacteroidota bacterium]
MRLFKIILLILPFFFLLNARSQSSTASVESFQKDYQLHITKINEPIKLDGEFNEAAWSNLDTTSSFWKKYPTDIGRPARKTVVKVSYDDKFIYFGFICYDSTKPYISSLKRDIGHDGSDGIGIILDPTNQRTNGFFFVVNALNAQSEDQLPFSDGGGPPSWSWDNKWFSATKTFPDRWQAEIAIPFKSIRYTGEKLLWGLNFVRIDTKSNEYSTWTHMPLNFHSMDLGYTGALIWKQPPPAAGSNKVFIPYITGDVSSDQENSIPTKATSNAGFDAKIALNSSLNLDLTANPDFSQIEVDQQVTNLTRFNIFFPERRTFFLENSDLFSAYGIPPIRPFYSRSIGLDKDGNKIPILFGARLSGNVSKSTRIGFMNMETGGKGSYSPENFTAASINQKVFKRSVIKAYFLNRQSFISGAEKKLHPLDAYGRNAGVEFDYSNQEGTLNGWGSYHHSFKEGISTDDNYVDAGGAYNGRHFSFTVDLSNVGTNYYTDMGYVQRMNNYDAARDTTIRVGFKHIFNEAQYKIFPKTGAVNSHQFSMNSYIVFNPNNSMNESSQEFSYNMMMRKTGFLMAFVNRDESNLLYPTSFTGDKPLPVGNYIFHQAGIGYQTDFRKPVSLFVRLAGGGLYNGEYEGIRTVLTFRKQPHVNLALQIEYNKLKFPDDYGSTELFLIAPKVEINFTTNLFWTTFMQYNTQANNFNINSRLQYRYKPMSDLFLVYTDNYYTDPLFRNKNRAIVFKLNYWLNL